MRCLTILNPAPVAAIGGTLTGAARLLTPDPREACARFATADARTVDVDFGAVRAVDTIFLGYVASAAPSPIAVSVGIAAQGETALAAPLAPAPSVGSPYRHHLLALSAPVQARYVRLTLALGVGGSAGVLALGQAFAAVNGHDWGGGRTLADSSTVTRLLGGGVAAEEGATFGGYAWTFSDLSDAELDALYQLARDRGVRRPLLVVEDPEATAGLNERIHWSLFTKFDAYERTAPGMSKWALKVEDWL